MEYADLGRTGEKISVVGFGGWAIGGHGYGKVDDSESIAAVRKALEVGINIFDTADVYGFGHSEEVLSKALGSRIGDVVVATKAGVRWDESGKIWKDCSPGYLRKALEGSLGRLKTDCIPLYQLHWHDGVTPLPDVFGALFRFRDEGKIRHVGCSNIPCSAFRDAGWAGEIVSAQLRFSMTCMQSSMDLAAFREQHGMATLAHSVLARGLLSGKYGKGSLFGEGDTRGIDADFRGKMERSGAIIDGLKEMAARYGKTPSQVAVRWVLDDPHVSCALAGMKNERQVLENAAAAGWRLDKEDRVLLVSMGAVLDRR